ncbi:MAG: glycosyltransferase family 9 protein [Acidiferrobacterales bacterium]
MTPRQELRLAVRRLQRLLEFLTYGIFDHWVLRSAPLPVADGARVAIVHLELIGDFFLWLPYGHALANALRDQDREVILVCSAVYADLAVREFSGCQVVAIDRGRFVRGWRYRASMLRRLRRIAPRETLQPSYPRDGIIMDAVVRALSAPALGWAAEFTDRPWVDRAVSRRLYARLLSPLPDVHQHRRHGLYLREAAAQAVLGGGAAVSNSTAGKAEEGDYLLVSPGASRSFRSWPAERFSALARRILQHKPGWRCIVVGTAAEHELAAGVVADIGLAAVNRAGETNLEEYLRLIAGARLVLGNDSAAGHIAAFFGTPSVVALGGGNFGRCYPYDPAEAPVAVRPVAVYQRMDCFGCNWICCYRTPVREAYPCLQAITVDAMWDAVQRVLGSSAGACSSGATTEPAAQP